MTDFGRYGIYYLPDDPGLAAFGAAWLGHDVQTGQPVTQPDIRDVETITATPRKYGFHGTLKPPFRLAEGRRAEDLFEATAALAARLQPARADTLRLARLGKFLALVPVGDAGGIGEIAGACVTELDAFRAPASEAELAKRRAKGLTERQDTLLQNWGYPYVLEEFRFHLTLSGGLDMQALDAAEAALETHLPALPSPFEIASISLVGERADGHFVLIQRFGL